MFKSSSVIKDAKQDSAVLPERFYRNLWSNQSPFWLQRSSIHNKLSGVPSKEQAAETRVGKPPDPRFTPLLTQFTPSSPKPLSRRSSLYLSIAIVRNFLLRNLTSRMIGTGLRSKPSRPLNTIPTEVTTLMSSTEGLSLRPKTWRRLMLRLKITQNIENIAAVLKTAQIFFPYLSLRLVQEMTSYLLENFLLCK